MADLYTVLLDGSLADPALLGGKGAWLARLVGWGLPVPTTGVVTSEGFRSAFEHASLGDHESLGDLVGRIRGGEAVAAEEVDAAFQAAPLHPALVAEIQSLARRVGGGNRIAVRSSATAEDMKQVSFAGQYRSILDIDPADGDAVVDAVKLVFASLWHPAPVAYRRSFAVDESAVAMAAVMMAMVPARRAGVVFTVDPAGDGSTARIETVDGLADSLVSGRVTPVVTVLTRAGPTAGAPPDVARALELALEVEELAGTPQDVEWATDGDTVWLVQARPITTQVGDTGDGFDDPPADLATLDLTTAGIGEMLPGVLAPLQWDIGSHLVEEAMRSTFAALGVRHDDLVARRGLVRRVRGRAAMDFGLLARMAAQLPRADIDQLEEQYFGSRRPGRAPAPSVARRGSRLAAARHDIRVLGSRCRAELDAELVILTSADVADAATDLTAIDDSALAAYWLRLIDVAVRAMTAELGVAANAAAAYRRLELALGGALGPIEAGRAAIRLTTGAALVEPPDDRASAAVFAGPTWRELGQEVPAVHHNAGGDEGADGGADPVAELRRVHKDAPGRGSRDGSGGEGLRATMRMRVAMRAMEDAVDGLARRERTKVAVLLLGGEVRRVHMEAGRRLCGRGLLPEPGDVDLMSATELRAALLGTDSAPTPDVFARRRRALHRYQLAGPLPARFVGAHDRESVEVPTGRRLEGWAVSPGRYTGRAQVVSSPSDPFDADSVLVAVATDPSWSPLFARAGAVVLERGGPLSHAAILARELGLPAVTNVAGATMRLDGREVMVDGDSGIVVVTGEAP